MNNFWNRNLVVRRYITLSEMLKAPNPQPYYAKQAKKKIVDLLVGGLGGIALELNTPELEKLFQEYLYPRYYDEAVFFLDNADENVDISNTPASHRVCGSIYSWANSTQQTYGELVRLYEQEKAHLLDDIRTIATTEGSNTATNSNTTTHNVNVHTDNKTTNNGTNNGTNTATTTNDVNVNHNNATTNKGDTLTKNRLNEVPQVLVNPESDEFLNTYSSAEVDSISEGTDKGDTKTTGTVKVDTTSNDTTNQSGSVLGDTDTTGTVQNEGSASDTSKTTATTSTNKDTMINRLDEINQKLVDIYTVWSNDFGKNFIIW